MTQSQSAPPADGRTVPELVRGPVEAVNEKGILVAGQWRNYSRYAEVARPEVGQWVELVVKKSFISGLKLLGPNGTMPLPEAAGPAVPAARPRRRGPAPEPDFDGLDEPPAREEQAGGAPGAPADWRARREQVISRLAVLKAAAGFLARRPDAVPDDVLAVAIQWLVWVEEDDRVPPA
jgi:hypothetical protein